MEILELNVMEDHVHMIITLPPKISVSEMMGILKGETAISLFKNFPTMSGSKRVSRENLASFRGP